MDELMPDNSRSQESKLSMMDRRDFVRTGSGIVAVTILGVGCDDDGSGLLQQGTLRVVVTGRTGATGPAGSVRLFNATLDVTVEIPQAGVAEHPVPAGTYSLLYTPPSGYVLAQGQTAQREVTITAGATVESSFAITAVAASTGVVRVVVTGLSGTAANGGSAQIVRTDATQAPVTLPIPVGGSAQVAVAVGSYQVTYTQPTGHDLTGTGQATLNVTANQTSTANFQVQVRQGGGTGSAIFFSDWRTVSGTSNAAKTDNGKWNIIADPGLMLEVVPGAPVGMPMANCLRVIAKSSHEGFARLAKTGLGTPAVGESWFYRWYYRHEQPSLNDNSQHPVETGNPLDWSFSNETISNTTWRPEFRPGGDQSNARNARWTGPVLQRSVTYRFELQIEKISNTEMRMHARIYSATGTLIADDDDFTNDRLGNTGSNLTSLASNPILHFATSGGASLNELRAGNNGISVGDWGPEMLYAYQGGFALRSGDWCGPYGSIQGEI